MDGNESLDNQNVCIGYTNYLYQAPICEGKQGAAPAVNYDDLGMYCYDWTIDPPTGWAIVGDPNASTIEIDWQMAGDYTVSSVLTPHPDLVECSGVFCTDISSIAVTVGDPVPVVLDPIFICPGSTEFYCGLSINKDTTVICVPDFSSCAEESQEFIFLTRDTIPLGVQVSCGTDCFELFGFSYCAPGEYNIPDPIDCEVRHNFIIEGFFADFDMAEFSNIQLGCELTSTDIIPDFNTNYGGNIDTTWFANGSEVQSGGNLQVDQAGNYRLLIEFTDLSNNCDAEFDFTATEDSTGPTIDVEVPMIDCQNTLAIINFTAIDPIDSITWSDENGNLIIEAEDLMVNNSGVFQLHVRGINGCTKDTIITVAKDDDVPSLTINYDNLDCIANNTIADFTSDKSITIVEWQLPDNSIVSSLDLIIMQAGDYQLTITADNGCSNFGAFTVTQDLNTPVIDAGEDLMWQCNTQKLSVDANIEVGNFFVEWRTVSEAVIIGDINREDIEVGGPGVFILNVRNEDNGCSSTDTTMVFENLDVPEFAQSFVSDASCFGTEDGIIQIDNIMGGIGPYNFFINGSPTEANTDFIENLPAGPYQVLITDQYDCELILDLEVLGEEEIIVNVPNDVVIGFNEDYTFDVTHNLNASDLAGIFWYDENGNLIGNGTSVDITGANNTILTVEVVHQNGCSIIRSIPIRIDSDVPIFAPNIFSPNDDGVNDIFTLFTREYPGIVENLKIYNRWGELVFSVNDLEFNDIGRGWDGTKNGQRLNAAVFTYTAKIKLLDGYKYLNGDVTLAK